MNEFPATLGRTLTIGMLMVFLPRSHRGSPVMAMSEGPMTGGLLVSLQFVLLGLLIWPWSGLTFSAPGTALCIVGVGLGLWALAFNRIGNFNIRPAPKPAAVLVTSGPYRYVRHPMYTALLMFGAGAALWYGTWPKAACWVALGAVLYAKSRIEEANLKLVFPEYDSYARRTRCLIPFVF